jgi:hypothetical protein
VFGAKDDPIPFGAWASPYAYLGSLPSGAYSRLVPRAFERIERGGSLPPRVTNTEPSGLVSDIFACGIRGCRFCFGFRSGSIVPSTTRVPRRVPSETKIASDWQRIARQASQSMVS